MPNYPINQIGRIADINAGIRVETSTFANTTYMVQTQQEMFTVVGRVMVLQLFWEAITAASATATTLKFNATFTTPAISVFDLSAACTTMSAFAAGRRVTWIGAAASNAAVVTTAAGLSTTTVSVIPQILGGIGFVGTLGILTAGANQTSGTSRVVVMYVPAADNSYMAPLV
jgi:hypothetical protein